MKLHLFVFMLIIKSSFLFSQDMGSYSVNPDSVLIKLSNTLNGLRNIKYEITRELNYSSENYHNLSSWSVYCDFGSKDTLIGFKYQINDSSVKQIFNGTEKFDIDIKNKTISVSYHPDKEIFNGLSALYNSIITLKNVLPILIVDKTIIKTINDTILNNTLYTVVCINAGKRRIQYLGSGFDSMTTKYDFIYKIILDKNSYLPVEVIQKNNLNSDFIKTSFSNLKTNIVPPSELTWYYSTYTDKYKLSEQKSVGQPLSNGTLAPDWKLGIYNNKDISLNELKGQVILLDFWIKNCGPCIQSVPFFKELQNKFKDKNFKLISINSYDSEEDIAWFCNKHQINYMVLINGESVANEYRVSVFPTFFIIDKSGKIIYSHIGYDASKQQEIEQIIDDSLK